ncbi:MAG: helix-turn-helix transcriptional regulator [Alphaproteobacteria bacterium]|nr:helix-turn-helix transcriptional regulator [Alphaproteobacteria bacterium]
MVRTLPVIVPALLAKSLKATRRRYDLTVREAAQLAGVSAATYSRIERHVRKPDCESLILLSCFVLALQQKTNGKS